MRGPSSKGVILCDTGYKTAALTVGKLWRLAENPNWEMVLTFTGHCTAFPGST